MMYDLGVRSFAIFFDDIEGEGTNPHKQTELLNDLSRDFVKVKGDVSNLIICPTDYSKLWAKPVKTDLWLFMAAHSTHWPKYSGQEMWYAPTSHPKPLSSSTHASNALHYTGGTIP